MYLNQSFHHQRGFLLPLAMFILVVMGIFAGVLSRNTIQTSGAATQEVIDVQTFYAGESGAQTGMQTLFFPDASSRLAVDTRCVAMNATNTYNVTGLNNCSSVVTCTCQFQDGSSCSPITAANYTTAAATTKLVSYYKISSVATCGSGNFRAVRTIEAGSYLKQE